METKALHSPGLICRQPAVGVRPAVSRSADLTRDLRRDWSEGRVEGEPEHKSRVVLQGLIMRAAGLVSWMLCLCWSEWLQADVANEGGAVVC